MSLYLCVDCGGSKTSAAISNAAGEIVGRALGGPSNFAYLGLESFKASVSVAVSNALKTCVSPPSIDPVTLPPPSPIFAAAWFGISGVDSQAAIDKVITVLSPLLGIPPGPQLNVCNDTHLLAAPLRLYDSVRTAVCVIGGTGGIVVGFKQDENGRLQELGRVGGWGWILGDEGGGFHVGREAIRQILLQADIASVEGPSPAPATGKPTLTARVLEHFGITDVYDLLTIIHHPDPTPGTSSSVVHPGVPDYILMVREKRLSQLSPLVFESAFEDQDPLAINILRTCANILVDQICILLRPDAVRGVKAAESVISFGGSLVGVEKYRNLILDELSRRSQVFKHTEMVEDAAGVGAKSLAMLAKALQSREDEKKV